MAKSVYVANLNPGLVRHEYHATFIELLLHDVTHDQNIGAYVPRMAGGCLGIYRNMSVDHFRQMCEEIPTLEWMWFLDSDIQLHATALDDLLAVADPTETPIVAGLYFMSLDGGIYPSIFDYAADSDDGRKHMIPRKVIPDSEVVTCGGTGAGCLLIHKDVFQKLAEEYGPPSPWFAESTLGGVAFGEDFTFCLRANAAGFPIRVHTGVEVGHVKNIVLSRNSMTTETP